MDAIADEILVVGGDSVAAMRRSSRPAKPTAKLQEKLQAVDKKTGAVRKMGPHQLRESENETENGLTKRAGELQMMEGATDNNAPLMQIMLRAMLQETSTHLIYEQKKMLESSVGMMRRLSWSSRELIWLSIA
ncbi:unnamed protein product [Fusarium venenatum]|uniref:Uncharacterized protein n=1 Tax=Fusarium venenatum TaxID=56646 RepID=A0A2L2TA85_9HYPO|nr:uncharacterized protein FVRRES_07929 [Fusarium venenatum]CEI67852.1 unnamed protein product [Fusarium venenatum]